MGAASTHEAGSQRGVDPAVRAAPTKILYRALAACAFVVSCREVIGIETRSEGPSLLALPRACMDCVESACADLERACASDPDCASLAACVASHRDDPAGRTECEAVSPAAASGDNYLALDACMRAPCQSDCTGIEGLLAERGAACDACLVTACEPQIKACIAERRCERTMVAAYSGPMNPVKAISVDYAAEADGATLRELDECLTVLACKSACGMDGTNFSCTGQFDWPAPDGWSVSFGATVLRTGSPGVHPVAAASLRACEPLSVPCSALASASTDAAGFAALSIPIAKPSPFRGYAQAFDPSPTPSFVRTNLFFGRPLYASAWHELNVYEDATLALFASAAGTTPLPGRAQVGLVFLDCNGRFATGVEAIPDASLVVDQETKLYYPFTGTPPTTQGSVLLINAAPGCHELRGLVGANEVYRTRFYAEADVVTVALSYPRSSHDDPGYVCTP